MHSKARIVVDENICVNPVSNLGREFLKWKDFLGIMKSFQGQSRSEAQVVWGFH